MGTRRMNASSGRNPIFWNLAILKDWKRPDFVLWTGILIFCVWLAIGLNFFDDYGGFTDELVEVQTASVNVKYIFSKLPMLADVRSLKLPMYGELDELPDLLTYKDRVYGVTALLPTVFINLLPGVSLNLAQFLKFRRLYIFLTVVFAAGCFFVYLRRRCRGGWTPVFGLAVLILSPRFFAESFYNSKDIVFFAWFLIALSCCGAYMVDRSRRAIGFFLPAFALTANARYFGFGLLPAFLALIALTEARAGRPLKEILRLEFLTLVGSVACFYLVSPYLWEMNLGSILSGLTFVTNLPGIGDAELFLGTLVAPRDVPLYLAVWIGITTPVFYLLLFLIGVGGAISSVVRQNGLVKVSGGVLFDLFSLGLILVYYALIVLSKATIYHGWRHAYFLYAPMLVLIASGFDRLSTAIGRKPAWAKVGRGIVIAGCVLSFGFTALWIAANHPLDFAYFNAIGRPIASGFSRDSWGVGSRPCIEYLAHATSKEQLQFGVNEDLTYGASEFTLWALPESVSSRFRVVWKTENADAFCYSYKNYPGNDYQRPGFRLVKTFFVDGAAVVGAYVRE